jgi:hypothetical protein
MSDDRTFLVLNDPSTDYNDPDVMKAMFAKIRACPDRATQETAISMLVENLIQRGAAMAVEGLKLLAESGEEITDEARSALLELVELVDDTPVDFQPGDRLVLDLDDMPEA